MEVIDVLLLGFLVPLWGLFPTLVSKVYLLSTVNSKYFHLDEDASVSLTDGVCIKYFYPGHLKKLLYFL